MTELKRPPRAFRPARRVLVAPAVFAVLGLLAAATWLSGGRAAAQGDPFARLAWKALPGDAPLGGHAAVADASSLTLLGGESGDFQPPAHVRALPLGGPSAAWATRDEQGDPPRAGLAGRGVVGLRAVRTSADGAAETAVLTICHCAGDTTYEATWSQGGIGPLRWRAVAAGQVLPHANGLLAYDAPRRRVVAAGGEYAGTGDIVTGTWTLDLNDGAAARWRPRAALGFQLIFQAADRDPRSGHLVAFGGQGADAVPTAALWRGDLAAVESATAWRDISALAGAGPIARVGATLTFVGDGGWAILYGGYSPERGDLADVWALDYRDPNAPRWRALLPAGAAPPARSGHAAAWDGGRGEVVVYGGLRLQGDGVAYLSDAFAIDLEPEVGPTPTTPIATTPVPTVHTPSPVPTTPAPTTPAAGTLRIFLPTALKVFNVRAAP